MRKIRYTNIIIFYIFKMDRDSIVGIATHSWLDGPVIESR